MLPGPTNVPDDVWRAMSERPIINHRGSEFRALYRTIVEKAKQVFLTESDLYILTSSGTGGIECAISNVVKPGDKVIVTEFGIFGERIADSVKRYGGKVVSVKAPYGEAPRPDDVREAVERAGNVKMVAVVYNETSTGVKLPELCEIGEITEDAGAIFFVDAISILGGDELRTDDWSVDICVTGSQKCLACPPGLALISVSEKAWEAIDAKPNSPLYFDLVRYKRYFEEHSETPFTPAVPLFYALDRGLSLILEEGLDKRIERHRKCARAFYRAVEAMKLSLFAKREFRSPTVIAINAPEGFDGDKIREITRAKYGVVMAGGFGEYRKSMIRIGSMGIISKREVHACVNALGKSLQELEVDIDLEAGIQALDQEFST